MEGLRTASSMEMRIVRQPLREAVHARLLDEICQGALVAGSRLSDVTLAARLGVSRTPVREALLRLQREGMVRADMGRGFVVEPLSAGEVRDLYPILWTLECLALRLTPLPTHPRLRALRAINRRLRAAKRDAEASLELDGGWHRELLAGCPNSALLEQIRVLKDRLRRYEYAYMRDVGRVELSTRHHDRIASVLSAGDLEEAVHWLERNWRISLERLSGWLASLEQPPSGPPTPSPRTRAVRTTAGRSKGARSRGPDRARARRP